MVATGILGEVLHPNLYFIAWWNSLCGCEVLKILGLLKVTNDNNVFLRPCWGSHPTGQRINTHLPITKAIYMTLKTHLKNMFINVDHPGENQKYLKPQPTLRNQNPISNPRSRIHLYRTLVDLLVCHRFENV